MGWIIYYVGQGEGQGTPWVVQLPWRPPSLEVGSTWVMDSHRKGLLLLMLCKETVVHWGCRGVIHLEWFEYWSHRKIILSPVSEASVWFPHKKQTMSTSNQYPCPSIFADSSPWEFRGRTGQCWVVRSPPSCITGQIWTAVLLPYGTWVLPAVFPLGVNTSVLIYTLHIL